MKSESEVDAGFHGGVEDLDTICSQEYYAGEVLEVAEEHCQGCQRESWTRNFGCGKGRQLRRTGIGTGVDVPATRAVRSVELLESSGRASRKTSASSSRMIAFHRVAYSRTCFSRYSK